LTASGPTQVQAVVAEVSKETDSGSMTGQAKLTTDLFPEGTVLIAGDPVRGQLTGANVLAY
jgi:hypothetical protein